MTMKIDSSLMDKLPGYHVFLGLAFYGLGTMAKDNLPQAIGSLPVIQLPCAFFSAVLIPFGSLLALRGLILTSTCRKSLLSYHLLGLGFGLVMLSVYFYAFLMMNLLLDLPNQLQLPISLPKLTENARSFPNEQKRMAQAQRVYLMYGVIVAYRLDNLGVAYYVPTEKDKLFWRTQTQIDAKSETTTAFIRKVTGQYPYLFGLYASTYGATFSVGWIWLLTKLPRD